MDNKTETDSAPVRAYTKGELAELYSPFTTPGGALRNLNRYLNRAVGLMAALEAAGYRTGDRHFTRRQVEIIFRYLGEP